MSERVADVCVIRRDFTASDPGDMLLPIQIQAATNPERVIRFKASDDSVDRAGDVILQDGWDLTEYIRNPVVTKFHDNNAWPIGKAIAVGVIDNALYIDAEFDPPEVDEEADMVLRKIKHGSVKAGSVGFIPIERELAGNTRRNDLFAKYKGAERIFVKSRLVEWTICPLPMNPNALAASLAARYDEPAKDTEAAAMLEAAALWSIVRKLDRIESRLGAAKQ